MAQLAQQCEETAASVDVTPAKTFQAARKAIIEAIDAAGLLAQLNAIALRILGPEAASSIAARQVV